MGAADHQTQQRGEEFGRPVVVGVRQSRTPRQFGAQMVEPRPVALDPADNLTQARRAGKLPVQHGQKLTFRRQPANPSSGPVLLHQCVELLRQHVLQQLMKNAIVMAHGIDPRSCPDRSPTIPNPVESMPCAMYRKNVPDSLGPGPAIHAFERRKQRRGCADQVRARRLKVARTDKSGRLPLDPRLRGGGDNPL